MRLTRRFITEQLHNANPTMEFTIEKQHSESYGKQHYILHCGEYTFHCRMSTTLNGLVDGFWFNHNRGYLDLKDDNGNVLMIVIPDELLLMDVGIRPVDGRTVNRELSPAVITLDDGKVWDCKHVEKCDGDISNVEIYMVFYNGNIYHLYGERVHSVHFYKDAKCVTIKTKGTIFEGTTVDILDLSLDEDGYRTQDVCVGNLIVGDYIVFEEYEDPEEILEILTKG